MEQLKRSLIIHRDGVPVAAIHITVAPAAELVARLLREQQERDYSHSRWLLGLTTTRRPA